MVLRYAHEEECGNHTNERNLSLKILRFGYYLSALRQDALDYTKRWNGYYGEYATGPGHKVFMLAMMDYFSKWIEAEAFKQVTSKESTPRYPQANGQAESSNKIIINNLKRGLTACKGKWVEELPWVLWSDRTTPKTSTSQMPYILVYGTEAVLPTEVMIPTARYRLSTTDMNDAELAHDKDTVDEL
ncbi:uncharacterized protein LOC141679964 [Apium graveolens]|uniref:uncharacterized protein LOC141679964 n=1 Tax=Apium graveolens TaxID=4045 RepID=UPI003D7B8626